MRTDKRWPGRASRAILNGFSAAQTGGRALRQILAVGLDDLLEPVEAVLAGALERALVVVVLIDVDEAVALVHLAGRSGYEVDAAPRRVADEVHAVLIDRELHLLDVVAEVVDTVVVVDGAVRLDLVVRTETVLHDEKRQVIHVGEPVERVAQAHRVDLPTPVARLDVLVADEVARLVVVEVRVLGVPLGAERQPM